MKYNIIEQRQCDDDDANMKCVYVITKHNK